MVSTHQSSVEGGTEPRRQRKRGVPKPNQKVLLALIGIIPAVL
jgi:hypothetical protein